MRKVTDYSSLNNPADNNTKIADETAAPVPLPVPTNDNIPRLLPTMGDERVRRLKALKRMMMGIRLVT